MHYLDATPGVNILQDTNYTATCPPSRKLYKLDEPDTQDTAGEARTNSSVMYSYGPPHIAKQKQDDQLEHTYSSYVRIRDVAPKTCQKRWMIGRSGERGSWISVLAVRHDDDYFLDHFKLFVFLWNEQKLRFNRKYTRRKPEDIRSKRWEQYSSGKSTNKKGIIITTIFGLKFVLMPVLRYQIYTEGRNKEKQTRLPWGSLPGIVNNEPGNNIVVYKFEFSFTFGLMPLEKV